jgi:hypothetical protein
MKKYLFILPIFLLFIALSGCDNFGKEKTFNGVELYHTDKVTDAEADSLASFLLRQKFADGNTKTVQLTKSGNTYQFRFVVKEGIDKDPEYAKTTKFFASLLSADVFNGAPVEVHMCDDRLNTLKVLTGDDFGKKKNFNGVGLYYTSKVTGAEADSLGNFLISSKFANGRGKSALITKAGDIYQFKFVVKSGVDKDTAYLQDVKAYAGLISKDVFHGATVNILLCDDYFGTLTTVPMDNSTR